MSSHKTLHFSPTKGATFELAIVSPRCCCALVLWTLKPRRASNTRYGRTIVLLGDYDNAREMETEITVDQLQRNQGYATPLPRPIASRPFRPRIASGAGAKKQRQREKEAERECGICFELAVSPIRTLCCAHLFCAEHIASWLTGPASDGRCPTCRAPLSSGRLLALGHPRDKEQVPRAPPPSSSTSSDEDEGDGGCTTPTARSYAAYPSFPAPTASRSSVGACRSPTSPSSPTAVSSGSSPSSSSEEEDAWEDLNEDDNEAEDSTDYSLPALVRARALQTRRHVPHPLASLLGVRAALGRVVRVAGWVLVVGVLAARAGAGGGWA
ncbi:hypothetical protein DFH06DRAFT_612595 [Mycena polygramma]|nr:hypothetical protein DFH06DRAFT_612595 [Mycena polygramma]